MTDTNLYLFGAPRLEYHNQPVAIDTRKALALCAYLLIAGKPQSRHKLAAVFRPDFDQILARGALCRTLSTLRRSAEATYSIRPL
jgi:DNA-binding SARP family transcriptional activator